ncbi:MAG TPA: beta-galactosidase trimerization domain-containing protein, partial [Terriglobales bacterium]|nr:beta-galactosidase trimerization domain-containing protein [Terriglobales bacterium]
QALQGDLSRSLKRQNYLVTETDAQTLGWTSGSQFPPYDGQLRLDVYTHVSSGANMVEYWHWHSLHYGQETYWRGVLSHDLEPNRTYGEVTEVASELKRIGPQLVNLKKDNDVAILFSADSSNAMSYMPVSDRVDYMTLLRQMYNALYDLNVEPDFVQAADQNLSRYKVLLVPPLYSASDELLQGLANYVNRGGHIVMGFKSGFTNQYSTVRAVMAPGPLRAAAGFHYQEFTNLAEPEQLQPDPYGVGDQNKGAVWEEFIVPETAKVIASFTDPYWHFPAITRNQFGSGTLTYEATYLTDALQREVIRDVLKTVGLTGPDQSLPLMVKVRHGRNTQGRILHYFLNFSGDQQSFPYPYANGEDLLTNQHVSGRQTITLKPWNLAIVAEGQSQ